MRIFAHKSISNMKLTLPKRIDGADPVTLDSKVWVVIGTNGAGKSSFGVPYLSPVAPISPEGMRDFPIMTAIPKMHVAPISITGKRIKRTGKEEKK